MEDPPPQSGSGGAAAVAPDATVASAVAGFAADTSEGDAQPVLREEQIVNAVLFLSHPKVRGSAEAAKRTFLEKKGLTAAEIEEAFKRVPPEAPAAAAPTTSTTPTVGANNLVTYTQQPQQALHAPQHVPVMAPQPLVPAQQMVQRPPVHWSQVVLGVGVAAAGLYGLHQLLYPRLSAWSHQLFSARSAAAEAEAERTAALTAALERLSEGQTRLQQSLEGIAAAVNRQQQRPADQLGFAESQADYLALPGPSSLTKRSQQQYNSGDTYASSSRAAAVRGGGWDPYAQESSQHLPSEGRPGSAASPSGRNPSGFYGSSATGFEVTPPPMGNYRAPQPPAQYGNAGSISNAAGPSGTDPGYARRTGAYAGPEASAAGSSAAARPEEAPRSAAFHEVMAMVQAGITPPNVRTDIDDNPPDPSRPLSAPQIPPRAKPWEASTVSSNVLGTPGAAYSSNVVPDGPSGFGVRSYGGAATAGPVTPTSAPRADASNNSTESATRQAGGDAGSAAAVGGSSGSGFDAPGPRSAGYDLSQLLGPDAARDAPWRPPPPPAATVQRPVSSGSTTTQQPLAAAASAPPAEAPQPDLQAAVLPGADSAPPASTPAAAVVDVAADAALAAAAVPQVIPPAEGGAAATAEAAEQAA